MKIDKPAEFEARRLRQRTEQPERSQKKLEKAIGRFNHAHMSNTKWRKAFTILSSPDLGLRRCNWKYVDEDRIFVTSVLQPSDLLETHFADGTFFPEVTYREIEWIEIPAQYSRSENPPRLVTQNVEAALAALNAAGQFPAEITSTGLIIRGYS